jgi:hypothetical protein
MVTIKFLWCEMVLQSPAYSVLNRLTIRLWYSLVLLSRAYSMCNIHDQNLSVFNGITLCAIMSQPSAYGAQLCYNYLLTACAMVLLVCILIKVSNKLRLLENTTSKQFN